MKQGEEVRLSSGYRNDEENRSLRRNSAVSLPENEQPSTLKDSYVLIPYGFQSKAHYKPKSKSKEITGVTYNARSRQFIILDSKGVTAWSFNNVVNSVFRLLEYPSYQFNLIRLLLHSKKYNVYFGLSKDYALKVFNLNFHEVFSVVSDMNSVLCMVFNSVTDELITGGTGGVKFWSFGEIKTTEPSLARDSRPMANYGLILRFEHPGMSGSWVKDILLDESNQRLYCLSERNVVAYDLEGNFLFMLKSAHQGLVTGCVFSKHSNLVVTGGNDCLVNVWSSNGGRIHSFKSHTKTISNILIHPQAPSLVLTASHDGTVKIFSLDIMEEIYSHTVFPEGVILMRPISNDIFYCSTSKALQVFSINHIADYWTTIRCPLKQLRLSSSPHSDSYTQKVVAVAADSSTRILSKKGGVLSTVLPPPSVGTSEHDKPRVCAHAYSPEYGLMYLLVNQHEIWVYYTKTNPANRVEVWQLSDVRDIQEQDRSRPRTSPLSERTPNRRTLSPLSLYSSSQVVDGVPCLALAFLNSHVILNNSMDEENDRSYVDNKLYLVAGLQDGRLLFLSPFAASIMYHQLQTTKGSVVSIYHDIKHNSLVLQTATLNEFAIQIRRLPVLDLQYLVNVGNDVTCFARMNEKLLSGHETGRLYLHRLVLGGGSLLEQAVCENPATLSEDKPSKDHSDVVLSVDSREELGLFCTSSKDGYIKIWNDNKILLRDIVMDKTLTTICFLNSKGDLLAGFKNHLFFIGHEKAHLANFGDDCTSHNRPAASECESEVYEDPRIRFEYKKTFPPEPVRMETYLVPFANMSINLARYLSRSLLPLSSCDDHVTSDDDQSSDDGELSDMFSNAPTDLYMSQSHTPLSRSRSSSITATGSWDLPRLGSSPVSSPPRTPPPVMTPVLELESDDDDVKKTLFESSEPRESFSFSTNNVQSAIIKPKQEAPVVRSSKVTPRRTRAGITQVKIDSRSLRVKPKIQKEPAVTAARDDASSRTNTNAVGDLAAVQPTVQVANLTKRSVVKKTKRNVIKSLRRDGNEQTLGANNEAAGSFNNRTSENVVTGKEKAEQVDSLREEQGSSVVPSEDTRVPRGSSAKREENSMTSEVAGRGDLGGNMMDETDMNDVVGIKDKATTRGDRVNNTKSIIEIKYHGQDNTDTRKLDKTGSAKIGTIRNDDGMIEPLTIASQSLVNEDSVSRISEKSHNISSSNHFEKPNLSQPGRIRDSDITTVENNGSVSVNEYNIAEDQPSDDYDDDDQDSVDDDQDDNEVKPVSKLERPVSKSVSFLDPENLNSKDQQVPSESSQQTFLQNSSQQRCFHIPKLKRHSRSALGYHSSTVVPYVESRLISDGQRTVPSSALRIYTLAAKMGRRPSPKVVVVPKPPAELTEISEKAYHVIPVSRDDGARYTPTTSQDDRTVASSDVEPTRISVDCRDVRGTKVITRDKVEDKNNRGKRDKDLVGWCLRALSAKEARHPVVPAKPRLRSRRSMHLEKVRANGGVTNKEPPANQAAQVDINKTGQHVVRIPDPNKSFTTEEKPDDIESFSDHFARRSWSAMSGLDVEQNSGELDDARMRNAGHSWENGRNSNIGVYSDGWQDRHLERNRELKEKHVERERQVVAKQRYLARLLEEKRRFALEERRLGTIRSQTSLSSCATTTAAAKVAGQGAKSVYTKTSYEEFRNNPVLFHPYRLGKFDSKDESWVSSYLDVHPEQDSLPENIFEFISRPKSAPSIPSKCRKFMLVTTAEQPEEEGGGSLPEPTPLEETLLLQRFPNTKLKSARHSSAFYRQRHPKTRTVEMPCK